MARWKASEVIEDVRRDVMTLLSHVIALAFFEGCSVCVCHVGIHIAPHTAIPPVSMRTLQMHPYCIHDTGPKMGQTPIHGLSVRSIGNIPIRHNTPISYVLLGLRSGSSNRLSTLIHPTEVRGHVSEIRTCPTRAVVARLPKLATIVGSG